MEKTFLENVKNHKVHIAYDTESLRHLKCSNGRFKMSFDIMAWDDYLCIVGDMGCYIFRRNKDMFSFFRQKGELGISPGYWSEKLTTRGGFREWDCKAFESFVKKEYRVWCKDQDDVHSKKRLWEMLKDEVLFDTSSEWESILAARDFTFNGPEEFFRDFLENSFNKPTFQYLWCCWAIVWAIREYDLIKEKGSEVIDSTKISLHPTDDDWKKLNHSKRADIIKEFLRFFKPSDSLSQREKDIIKPFMLMAERVAGCLEPNKRVYNFLVDLACIKSTIFSVERHKLDDVNN